MRDSSHRVASNGRRRRQKPAGPIVGAPEITKEVVQVWVYGLADCLSPTTKMKHARRGNRHLGRRVLGARCQKAEVLYHRVAAETNFTNHPDALRFRHRTLKRDSGRRCEGLAAIQPLEKVKMPHRAAELAIRGAAQAH